MLQIRRFINPLFTSNCFVVYEDCHAVIIDPGMRDCTELIAWIENANIIPDFIMITHEHFDHLGGIDQLRNHFGITLIAPAGSADILPLPKKNLSLFTDNTGFAINPPDASYEESRMHFLWQTHEIQFILTPGHSPLSYCIMIDSLLFSGDTLLKDLRTVTQSPGGSKEALACSLDILFALPPYTRVLPGHGEEFLISEMKKNIALGIKQCPTV